MRTASEIEAVAEKAVDLKNNKGFNCCQSVVEALSDEVSLDSATLSRLAAGFGGGAGNGEGACGALSGAIMIAGLRVAAPGPVACAADEPDHVETDAERRARTMATRQVVRRLHDDFRARTGASVCKILKTRDAEGRFLCECADCVRSAVRAYFTAVPSEE